MTPEQFGTFVDSERWTFAKTMPRNPHHYIVRANVDDNLFVSAVTFIREHGYVEQWYKYRFTYYDYNGHKYWTMGSPLDETIILNRASLESI